MRSGFNRSSELYGLKSFLLRVLSNNIFLSILISALIIYLLPPLFERYKAEITRQAYKDSNSLIYYGDFNDDGRSERILFGQFRSNYFSLMVFEKGKVIEQWNLEGEYVKTVEPIISPTESRKLSSIYFFVLKLNKIYLYQINPFTKETLTLKYVDDYFPRMEGDPCQVFPLIFYDSNKDGVKEFYFALDAGYSIQPRRLYRYDPTIDSVYKAAKSFANIPPHLVVDTTGNRLKIIYTSNAYGNSKITDPFTDQYTWLMGYNEQLDFIKPPVKRGIYSSHSSITSIRFNNKIYYVYENIYEGIKDDSSSLCLLNSDLEVMIEKRFYFYPEWGNSTLYSAANSASFYAVRKNGLVLSYDMNLQPLDSSSIPRISDSPFLTYDLDNDGQEEILFINEAANRLIICRNDFRDYSSVNIPVLSNYFTTSVRYNGNKHPKLVISVGNKETELTYGFNNLFYLRYPIYAGIYLGVFLFLTLIAKIQKHRAEVKYETEKSIAELQLKAIKNQVDPHFTLNIINSIGSLLYKQDKEKADYIFGKYSKLLRTTILNSDKIVTTLGDELEYVENYLELERYRNGYNFNWKIDFDKNADKNIQIPKMLIHTFVENAIKHGIRHLEKDGDLYIGINKNEKNYHVIIRDNGIGRKQSEEIEKGNTGKGLGILDQILDLYYNLMRTKITYKINDLTLAKITFGTEIIIDIPI